MRNIIIMNKFVNSQKKLSELTFVICGIVRDAEKGLCHNIPVIEQFCKMTSGYNVVIFENDSKDNTKGLLKQWADRDKHVQVFCEIAKTFDALFNVKMDAADVNPFYSHKRIAKMVELRNQYMDYIWDNGLEADYLMVVDLDVDRIDLAGIVSCFKHSGNWDAVTAFGYSIGPKLRRRYHDTFALEVYDTMSKPRTEQNIYELQDKYRNLNGDEWIRVDSAFGGLAIYRYDAIMNLRYKLLDNDDKRVACRCEHTSISIQMKERGYDKIFINPQMKIHYQRLTLKIIWNSLFRKLETTYRETVRNALTPPQVAHNY